MPKHFSISQNIRRHALYIVCITLTLIASFLLLRVQVSTTYARTGNFLASDNYAYHAQWGSAGSSGGQFVLPRGVALDSVNGRVYVADESNNRIQKFDTAGNYLGEWGGLKKPYGVAVAPDGSVYVTNTKKNQVRRYTADGQLLVQWGGKGNGDGKFLEPRGIAVDKKGNVYVADTKNNRIQKFKSNGAFVAKWGTFGSGNTQFAYPYGVAVDKKGNVFVADTSNHRVVKYGKNLLWKKSWGGKGAANRKFDNPRLIAIDNSGAVYVTDAENDRTQKFNGNGNFLSKFGGAGAGDGKFDKPHGIAVEPNGDYVYVGDTYHNRVQKFRREGIITDTPTPTATFTKTFTPTNTNTPVHTFTPTNTRTNTPTFTPTRTNTPSPTPTFTMFGDGSDGDLTVFGSTQYTDDVRSGLSLSSAGTTLNVSSTAGFAAGQEVLVHQSRGTGAGQYEFAKIASVGIGQLILTTNMQYAYVQDSTSRAQVMRVLNLNNVTVQNGGTLTSHAWDGNSGGLLVFRAKSTVSIQLGGIVDMDFKGFAGGNGGAAGGSNNGNSGEGPGGGGGGIWASGISSGGPQYDNSALTLLGLGSGGGGGSSFAGGSYPNPFANGGGGGGHSNSGDSSQSPTGTAEGSYVGSRGGDGGTGGGSVILYVRALTVNGLFTADGENGEWIADTVGYGTGGGGAGGAILVKAENLTLGSGLVTAKGGSGGGYSSLSQGIGGSGSDGRIRIEYCGSGTGTTNPPASVQIITCQ